MYSFITHEAETNVPRAPEEIKAILPLLLQVDGGLSVETLVLPLHVGEAREVVGVNEGEIHLKKG